MDERLIARKEAVPSGQEIALQPALALVLAEHLHNPAVRRQMIIPRLGLGDPGTICDLEHILPAVRVVLVGTEQPEISALHVQLHHVAQEPAHHACRFGGDGARCGQLHSVVTKIRKLQLPKQQATVRVRIGAHAAVAPGSKVGQVGPETTALVEEVLGLIALHPLFEKADVRLVLMHLAHRHLMGAPVILRALAIDLLRTGPALGRAQHDHWPAGPLRETVATRVRLDALDLADDLVQGRGHKLMHRCRLMPLDEIRRVAVAAE